MLYCLKGSLAHIICSALGDPDAFAFRNFIERHGVMLFVDSPESPQVFVALRGADFMLHSSNASAIDNAMQDLFALRFAAEDWPDEAAQREWRRAGGRYLFVNSSPLQVWEAGLKAGFVPPSDYKPSHKPAYLYWFAGQPRFSAGIVQSCRLGRGMELWHALRQGISYDSEGGYVREVLQEKPSFVCEDNGRPVCWSTIHLNGTMGMIFTPPTFRRRGYARSLACFQIDHELRRQQFAGCHVVGDNQVSADLLLDLGANWSPIPIVWRTLVWPKN